MLSAIAIVPSAPLLVPELAGAATSEIADLSAAVSAAAALLPTRWLAVGVGARDMSVDRNATGTFAGFGADVRVRLSPGETALAPSELPVCALIAAWVRGQVRPDAEAQVRVYAADQDPDSALAHGRALRAEIDDAPEPVGVLVVADGANTLTPKAPGGYGPDSVKFQLDLDDALASGNLGALRRLPPQILGRTAFHLLAGLAGPGPRTAKELYRGAPYGVGYFAGVWQF